MGPDSDVDFLGEAGENITPFFPGGLIADLEELLKGHLAKATERVALRGARKPTKIADPIFYYR